MSRPLWTAQDVVAATGGTVRGASGNDALADIIGISIDSRTVEPGDLFIAIAGDRFDGHDFVDAALDAGASAALVSANQADRFAVRRGGLIIVPDSYQGLYDLARVARARSNAKIIAVTGSVGKTSTKETLRLILSQFGRTHAPVKSFNNHWGVPLTLCRMPPDADFGVFEIGMNHSNEITPLSQLVRPDVAMITTIAPVHLENLGSLDAIAAAKAEVFDGLTPGGTAVIHGDIAHAQFLKNHAERAGAGRVMTFGHGAGNTAELMQVVLLADCSSVDAKIDGKQLTYKVGAPGEHLVINSLGVLAVCASLDLDLALCGLALASMEQPDGRGRRHTLETPGDPITLLDESYNANPTSVRAALKVLARLPLGSRGRRIAVLGDMLELGEDAEDMHAALGADLQLLNIDRLYACGPMMKTLWRATPVERRGHYAGTSDGLRSALSADLAPGDAVMIKGSLGSRMGPLVELLLQRYQER